MSCFVLSVSLQRLHSSSCFHFVAKVSSATIGSPDVTSSDNMADTWSQEFKNPAKKIIQQVWKTFLPLHSVVYVGKKI